MKNSVTSAAISEAVELAYGLLWLTPKRDDKADRAREALYSILDSDGRIRGIKAAQDALALTSNHGNCK